MQWLWTDLHSNIHHQQMQQIDHWTAVAKELFDFWPIAYYPFHMFRGETGAPLEGLIPIEDREADWEIIRRKTQEMRAAGFPMFMGYEWQGAGLDGDHNVFYLDTLQDMHHPLRYEELCRLNKDVEAIAIPHHVAYQLGSRGKNWATHNERFSPFAEIYSSHGCSENDTGDLDMTAHLHMGPRTGETCYEQGLILGKRVGCIASGDNHVMPGSVENGLMCVLAEDCSIENLWQAMRASHVYGVSRTRMQISYDADGAIMGSTIAAGSHFINISVRAADAIDRIELLEDNCLIQMFVCSGTWERREFKDDEPIKVKFAAEFGWGPNPKHYAGFEKKSWEGSLQTSGRIISVEKVWHHFGQNLNQNTERSAQFSLTTYMPKEEVNWMSSGRVKAEGFVFEVEGKPGDHVKLSVDGQTHTFTVRDLMKTSRILAQYKESEALAQKVYGNISYHRDDLIWHNAYKCRLRQAVPEVAYSANFTHQVNMKQGSQYRIRVHLKNGDRAWVSPIFAI